MNKSSQNNKVNYSNPNGGFPPLIFKNDIKIGNNKERFITSSINNNINIRQILQTKTTTNILDKIKDDKDELDIVNNL